VMQLPAGVFEPRAAWALAPPRGKKPPAWEASLCQFGRGKSVDAIAMTQESGRAIQPRTVIGHLLTALTAGRGVDLQRLAAAAPPPTRDQWEQLADAEARTAIDVVRSEKLNKTDLLSSFVPEAAVEFSARSPREQAVCGAWFAHADWYCTLRRIGLEPRWGPDPKRQRA